MYTGTLVDFLGIGGPEMMLIMVVMLLLFGGKKLPELARGLGKGLRDFKDASEGVKREIHRNINSVGITDDINDMINDVNGNDRHHPSEINLEKQMYPQKSIDDHTEGTEVAGNGTPPAEDHGAAKAPDTVKEHDVAANGNTASENSEIIKTDKTI